MKVSEKTYGERIKAIYSICKRSAYELEEGGKMFYLVSLWELAERLNNEWYAKLFFTEKELEHRNISYIGYRLGLKDEFALKHYELHHYLSRLKTTIKKIKGASVIIIPKKFNVWAKIPTK